MRSPTPHPTSSVNRGGSSPPQIAAITNIKDAERRRTEAMLRDEELPDQDEEARAWGDR